MSATNASPGSALVTGASSGIGLTYAERLAARGYDLVLVARDVKRLDALAARLTGTYGVKADVLPADLSVREDVRKVEQRIRSDATLTLVLNNAGIGPKGPMLDADLDDLDAMIDVNVTAVNRLAIAAAQVFAAKGRGGIINVASVVAFIPERFQGTYSATKAFVLNLTLALHSEVGGKGVRVQAVLPGLTRTEIFERSGQSIDALDPERVMEVGDMVDASLAGFDQGELVTIPSLPDPADLDAATRTRHALGPNLSHRQPAARYGVGTSGNS